MADSTFWRFDPSPGRGLDFISWQPLATDLVQSRRLPDGLIQVQRPGQPKPDLYILEIATYPEARVADQVIGDTAMVYL